MRTGVLGGAGGRTRRAVARLLGTAGAAGLTGLAGACAVGQSGTPEAAQDGRGQVAAPATIQLWPTWSAQF